MNTSPAPRHRAGRHRANNSSDQWFVTVDGSRPAGGRRRAVEPAKRSRLPMLGVGAASLAVVGVLGLNAAVDTDEVLAADARDSAEAAPQPLSDEARLEVVGTHLQDVPVPFPRNVQIHDMVAEARPTTPEEAIAVVDEKLGEWNLTPTGELVDNPCPPHARACVDVDNQLAWLQEGGVVTHGPVPNTTGKPGHETPRGEFTVLRKVRDEVSYVYNLEPMPFSVYFTQLGVAFHEGSLQDQSHGCIHLSNQDAVHFFDVLQPNDIVVVI